MSSVNKGKSKIKTDILQLENAAIRLSVGSDPGSTRIEDRKHKVQWVMDAPTFARTVKPALRRAMPAGRITREGDSVVATYPVPGGPVKIRWELAEDHIRVTLTGASRTLDSIDLPGGFRPARGAAQLLIPTSQGALYRGGDYPWEEVLQGGAHHRLSLSMLAIMGEKSALMYTAESPTDWSGRFGEDTAGPFAVFQMERCVVNDWYEREVRIYPVPSDITSIAMRYRQRVKERNEFVGWDEKIARKPILKNLFGACMAFTGYNKAKGVDYAGNARRMHEFGFKHVLYYPVRMCNYSLDFLMGGDAPIWLSDREIERIHEVPGAMVAPWAWYYEGVDDHSSRMQRMFKHDAAGDPYNGWRIEKKQWKHVCTPYQIEESKRRYKGDMKAMDWIHYDVTATRHGHPPCFRTDHDLHGNQPLDRRGDMQAVRELLGPETNGNRIVSSEGFTDRYTPSYDIGTTKLITDPRNRMAALVPLTSLVFHDSTIHDWWEVHNYNALPGFGVQFGRYGASGCGWGARKAAQDALYGAPPNVFAFGRQYSWIDIQTSRTFSFQINFDDYEVQHALALALPVSKLHAKIGRCAMSSFEFLSDDGLVQSTRFSNGTRVIANLGDRAVDIEHVGLMPANSWRAKR